MKDTYIQRCGEDPEEIGGLLYTMPFIEGSRLITHVWTNNKNPGGQSHRGHGHADQLMNQVTQDADRSGTKLHLQVGDGSPDIDLDRLSGLYKRHGFDWNDEIGGKDEGAMMREPRNISSLGAAKPAKKTQPKVRAPEEVWYDVHKHPAGVPGGMGKSPEHHLRGRGWSGHEINEGSGKKTIQYRNHKHPDFVISYGGGTSTKPDHNFRVLYMGTNTNVPKINRAYSLAEAMDKVEELHGLHNGLVVQPMTHSAAGPLGYEYAVEGAEGLVCPNCGSGGLYTRGFRSKQEEPDLGCNECREHLHSPPGHDVVADEGWERGSDAYGMTHDAATSVIPKPTVATQPNVSQQKTFVAPEIPPSRQDMTDDDKHPIGPPKITYPTTVDREIDHAPKKPRPQLRQIKTPPKSKPELSFKPAPITTTKTETKIKYASSGPYPRSLSRVAAVLQRAAEESWEEPKDYYHGTTEEDLDEVSPATSHRRGVVFPNQSDPEYAYATPSERNAWHYAELAWNATDNGIPRVYRVRPTGPVEEDPTHFPNGDSRGNFSDDVRSRHPFEVQEELPTPEHWQDDDDGWDN